MPVDIAPPHGGQPPGAAPRPARAPAALLVLYAVATALLLLPVWRVSRVPSVDGGCHLYNAFVMHHLHDPAYPLFARHFHVVLEPLPNWLIQVLLYLLLFALPLALAEKVLLTLYVLLFAIAAWIYAGSFARERAAWAFLALPSAWCLLSHFGFYNFLFSVPLALLSVAIWWRHRERLTWRSTLALEGVLLLCYFAHLVALAVALLVIGVLWLADLRWKARWFLHPLLLAPQLALPLWFVTTHGGQALPNDWNASYRWHYLIEQQVLFAFDSAGALRATGVALTLLLAALVAWTLVDGRPRTPRRHAFAVAGAAVTLLYFMSPGGVGEGVVLQPRLALFVPLVLLPALSFRNGARVQVAVAVLLTMLVAWESIALLRWHRAVASTVDAYLAGFASLPRNQRVVSLDWDRFRDIGSETRGHSVGYLVAEKGLLDWDDYQAGTGVFPLRFNPGVQAPQPQETGIDDYLPGRWQTIVDHVYTWALPVDSPVRPRLRFHYAVVAAQGEGRLWKRRLPP